MEDLRRDLDTLRQESRDDMERLRTENRELREQRTRVERELADVTEMLQRQRQMTSVATAQLQQRMTPMHTPQHGADMYSSPYRGMTPAAYAEMMQVPSPLASSHNKHNISIFVPSSGLN